MVQPVTQPIRRQLEQTLAVLGPVWDIVEGRVAGTTAPAWCEERGWSDYLRALSDEELEAAERHGLERALERVSEPPASLRELAAAVSRLVDPFRGGPARVDEPLPTSHVPLRKRAQIAALVTACRLHFGRATRVIEVGAGRGSAARALAGELDVPVLGIDRDPALIRRARELVTGGAVAFSVADGEAQLDLQAGDLALGLHACGGLGDALVRHAAQAQAHVLLVSCCLQKIAVTERAALSAAAEKLGMRLRRSALGLTNLAAFDEIGRARAVMQGRQTRHALRLLLASRGAPVEPGEESRGLHRRTFQGGLAAVAVEALRMRGLGPPSDDEIARYAEQARTEHARIRRLSLPRAMLGRVVEQAVVLDRAAFLEEHGYDVWVEPLFARTVSPRNLAILATAPLTA